MDITCSLIIPTYNWPEALELVLLSVLEQTVMPQEIIIGDDGSTIATKELIESYRGKFSIPLTHLWQEDQGNRKATMMNKSIAVASHPYIIEIDGDVILHPDFVKDHLSQAEQGNYLYGSRVNIQKSALTHLFNKKQIKFNYFSSGIKKRNRTLRIPFLANQKKSVLGLSKKLRGCNMSFWKTDFIKVNGYNEEFTGWGMEDSEMILRMVNAGIKGKRLHYRAIIYHIYHKEQDKSSVKRNRSLEAQTKDDGLIRSKMGVDQYL
ncbi:glycosyltransferase family 2 protein [Nonlabens antarcticus]|uniref:glycosyltransferase family 2 protein n=1 Tax=Nonlabens antarcticus TaxID=392714 RepID=UPI001E420EC0|nr:glycosyltransferase family 2 protein [Nonlabens antarcticus]